MLEKRVMHQIRNAKKVLEEYTYTEPLARFLTRFYKANRQMGSSDRRMTSRLCYNYFRLGNAFTSLSVEEKLVIAEFLCEQQSDLIAIHKPDWTSFQQQPIAEKVQQVVNEYGAFLPDVFPNLAGLSTSIDHEPFLHSIFTQPKLFIRAKRKKKAHIIRILQKEGAPFEELGRQAIALPNGFNVGAIRGIAGDYEVQDYASQQTEDFVTLKPGEQWWDCCAASGGKSLMMLDQCPNMDLMVSDVRLSILRNLEERFYAAGIQPRQYRRKILNLTQPVTHLMAGEQFDGILVDAPCSGSGTWGRTPEMMVQFNPDEDIARFTELQRSIIKNVLPNLKPGGQLVYMTCSVFAAENEETVAHIQHTHGLELIRQQTILGYPDRADSMFAASFRKKA